MYANYVIPGGRPSNGTSDYYQNENEDKLYKETNQLH